jgi:acetylornithine deacetylase
MNSVQILERLVRFASVSRDSNLDLIEFVRAFLAARGIESRLYPNEAGTKANLFASIGPAGTPGVLLSGHTDVVPVEGQRWSSDPFRLSERGERLYARGAADMKGFIACALSAADRASRLELRSPLQLALSYDEEIGCVGVRSLLADMERWSARPRLAIVGEPTLLATAIGHKGKTALRAVCHGRAAHSANPARGVNAIHLACELVAATRAQQHDIERRGARDAAYAVPHTTLHVGVIHGGTALNIVPAHCELELEIRNLPAEAPGTLVAALDAAAAQITAHVADPDARIELERTNDYPALDTAVGAEVVALVASLTGHREPIKVDFGSEAGLYSALGIPSVVCGPGSIEQAHKPDEFIARQQLERCDAMLTALIGQLT